MTVFTSKRGIGLTGYNGESVWVIKDPRVYEKPKSLISLLMKISRRKKHTWVSGRKILVSPTIVVFTGHNHEQKRKFADLLLSQSFGPTPTIVIADKFVYNT